MSISTDFTSIPIHISISIRAKSAVDQEVHKLRNQVWNGIHPKTDNWKCLHVKNSSLRTVCLIRPDLVIQCLFVWKKTRQFHFRCRYSHWVIRSCEFLNACIYSAVPQFVTVRSRLFSRPIKNLSACMSRKIRPFAQVNNKECSFYKLH